MEKFWKKWKWYQDPIFWRRMFIVMIISNAVMFISWLISIITLTTCMKVLDTLNKLMSYGN